MVIDNLGRLPSAGIDLDLLHTALDRHQHGRLREERIAVLTAHAQPGEVPLLRWGIRLALDLLGQAGDARPLTTWSASLAAIERRLSPVSVWTVWTE